MHNGLGYLCFQEHLPVQHAAIERACYRFLLLNSTLCDPLTWVQLSMPSYLNKQSLWPLHPPPPPAPFQFLWGFLCMQSKMLGSFSNRIWELMPSASYFSTTVGWRHFGIWIKKKSNQNCMFLLISFYGNSSLGCMSPTYSLICIIK